MAKLVGMYPKPEDTAHFEKFYREVHIPLVEKMPGIKNYSYGYPTGPDGEEGDFFAFSSQHSTVWKRLRKPSHLLPART